MGASQSSGTTTASAQDVKTSYYDLLAIERHATEDEIKRAYRRKALELHPDRNYGNEEYATTVFAEVQAAYEVLSDPQERAWYDSHESAILRGDDLDGADGDQSATPTYANIKLTTADDLARLVRRFNSTIAFTDAPSGFFGYLHSTFTHLASEEEAAARYEKDTPFPPPEYPPFGHKDDAYDDVVKRFYAAWSSFSTVKSFAWKDKYRLSEAPDRWYRRRMEQENKKLRQDGIREFNDAVRSLVAFVRKRDPRYIPSTQTEAERQRVLRDAAAAQATRARKANERSIQKEMQGEAGALPEWTKSREPDPLAEMEGGFEEEEDDEEEVFECVACNKIFKSERQWEAHERSKKHQKAVFALRKKMRKDHANLELEEEDEDEEGVEMPKVRLMEEDGEEVELGREAEVGEEEEEEAERMNGHATEYHVSDGEGEQAEDVAGETVPMGEDHLDAIEEAQKPSGDDLTGSSDSEDDDYASPAAIAARLHSTTLSSSPPLAHVDPSNGTETPATTAAGDSEAEPQGHTQPKIGKAAQKRAKRAAAAAVAAGSEQDDAEAKHKCVGCEAAFPTKTRLFQHLKDHPKHTALKPAVAAGGGGGKKRGKR